MKLIAVRNSHDSTVYDLIVPLDDKTRLVFAAVYKEFFCPLLNTTTMHRLVAGEEVEFNIEPVEKPSDP